MRLPVYGARRCLRDGVIAAQEGRIDDALACMRGYFGLRADAMQKAATQADAEAVMIAATCAAIRGDHLELDGAAALVPESDAQLAQARAWIATLRFAVDGDLPEVVAALRAEVPAAVKALGPSVLLVAAERDVDHIDEDAEALFRSLFGSAGELPAPVHARVMMIQARAALARGDRAAASAHLARVPAEASPFHAFAAALATTGAELGRRWLALAESQRPAAANFAATFAAGAPSEVVRGVLEACAGAPDAARDALRAALAGAQIREGKLEEAIADLGASDKADSLVIRIARAHVMIEAGRCASALRGLAPQPADPDERDLVLIAAAGAADDERLDAVFAHEVATPPSAAARDAVLRHLASGNRVPARLPAWLETAPEEPAALYAWAIVQARRERGDVAVKAFERAIALDPALANASDAPDVARTIAARDALRTGDAAAAEAQLAAIASPRVAATAVALQALVLARQAAASQPGDIDENSLGQAVRELFVSLPADRKERDAVGALARVTDDLRARWLLRNGRVDEARPVIARLAGDATQKAFYAGVLAVLEGRPLDECERELAAAVALPDSDALLGVLLAEVRGARGDAGARTATLKALLTTTTTIVDEALATGVGGPQRGLDAKRAALAEVRRIRKAGRGTLGAMLAAQLADALRFELPAAPSPPAADATTGGLRADTLADRAPLLAQLAAERAAHHPARRAAIEAAQQAFARALAASDAAGALAAEREVLRACRGSAS